jgi:hypothetical protein
MGKYGWNRTEREGEARSFLHSRRKGNKLKVKSQKLKVKAKKPRRRNDENIKEGKMKKNAIIFFILPGMFLLCSCASMYTRPVIQATLYRQQIPGNAALLFKTAQKLLPVMGYKLQGSDPQAGTITTNPVEMKVEPSDCDCGTALGLPVIKSGGTNVKATFILGVSNNELSILAEIVPELDDVMATLESAGMTMACVSTGKLEEALSKNFLETMKIKALQLIFK